MIERESICRTIGKGVVRDDVRRDGRHRTTVLVSRGWLRVRGGLLGLCESNA